MRFSDDRAVLPRRPPEQRHVTVLYLADTPPSNAMCVGLRAAGLNSEVRCYKAIPDGNGDYLRDKRGHVLLGEPIL